MAMAGVALLLALVQAQAPGTPPKASARNSTADAVVEKSLALGIDFDPPGPGQTRAAPENTKAYPGYAAGSWLDAQIRVADDSIAEPPKELRDFLEQRREPVWAIVAALEKGAPEWKATKSEEEIPRLLPWIRLHKVLLATALVAAHDGNAIDAERALEASWSLGQAFENEKTLIARMICVAVERWQAGVLRKFQVPPPAWMDRLDADQPWQKIAEAIETEGRIVFPAQPEPEPTSSRNLRAKAMAAIGEGLLKVSPCEREALSSEALFRPAAAVFEVEGGEEAKAWTTIYRDITMPNIESMVRRAARLSVDRELTLKILQLRMARAASRDHRWPEETEVTSAVCPGATYAYKAGETNMRIRFEGTVDDPEAGVVLPLEYTTLDSPPPPGP